jgi:hypothetical protein
VERAAPTIAIGRIAISNGTIHYRSGGVAERIDKLDLEASSQDVAGPARAAGSLIARGARLEFELDIDRIAERVPLRLALSLPVPRARIQLAGDLLMSTGGNSTFEGKATVATICRAGRSVWAIHPADWRAVQRQCRPRRRTRRLASTTTASR